MPPIRKSFQLDPEKDAELIAWLTSFANRYKMSDLIKLALYHLAEIEPSADLRQLQSPKDAPAQLSLFDAASPDDRESDSEAATPGEDVSAQFEAILQELVQLREALLARMAQEDTRAAQVDQSAAPTATTPESPPPARGEIESSGIDMSRPRRPRKSKRITDPPPDDPQEQPLDPDALARELLRSIGSFGQDG